jgi:hypothetical protein
MIFFMRLILAALQQFSTTKIFAVFTEMLPFVLAKFFLTNAFVKVSRRRIAAKRFLTPLACFFSRLWLMQGHSR